LVHGAKNQTSPRTLVEDVRGLLKVGHPERTKGPLNTAQEEARKPAVGHSVALRPDHDLLAALETRTEGKGAVKDGKPSGPPKGQKATRLSYTKHFTRVYEKFRGHDNQRQGT